MFKKVGSFVFTSFKYYCVVHCVTEHVADIFLCSGDSMEPSFHSGDLVIIQRFSKMVNSVDKGDVIIAKSPEEYEKFIMKRVKAVDGQMVRRGINYQLVPKGSVWLEGDNHTNSRDSWDFGPVPKGLIHGRVICRIWPLSYFSMKI
ncbi:PREDICTED: mitochondrial inner membrane protease subunit 1 [Diuraphis noxia]|uniref:mitochondrial inner membrane protease subunit 1 n=1 Tax=Diuraphis noxia TaxID=143948 RepID=UPI000763AAD0|nr:PREDICTED: mitochondrial inner membrane protease subunit 1 [Diuraphis noxia]